MRRKELLNKSKQENFHKNSTLNKTNEKKEQEGDNSEIETRNRYRTLIDKSESDTENELEKLLETGQRRGYRQLITRKDNKHKERTAKRKKYREMKEKLKMHMWNTRD